MSTRTAPPRGTINDNVLSKFKNWLFPREATPEEVREELEDRRDQIRTRIRHLEKQIAKELEYARANATYNQESAKAALRRKSDYTDEVRELRQTLDSINVSLTTVDALKRQGEVHKTFKASNTLVKKMVKETPDGALEDEVDELADNVREAQDRSMVMTQSIRPDADSRDEDIDNELNEIVQQDLDTTFSALAPASHAIPVTVNRRGAGPNGRQLVGVAATNGGISSSNKVPKNSNNRKGNGPPPPTQQVVSRMQTSSIPIDPAQISPRRRPVAAAGKRSPEEDPFADEAPLTPRSRVAKTSASVSSYRQAPVRPIQSVSPETYLEMLQE